jgi:hypothetical protein
MTKYAVVSTLDEGHFVRLFPDRDAAEKWAVEYLKQTQPAAGSIEADTPGEFLTAWEAYLGICEWFFVIECETDKPKVQRGS